MAPVSGSPELAEMHVPVKAGKNLCFLEKVFRFLGFLRFLKGFFRFFSF